MVNKFLKQKEPLPHIFKGKAKGALRQSNELQAGLTLTPRAWRLYLSIEVGKDGSGVGLVASTGKGMKDLHVFIDSKYWSVRWKEAEPQQRKKLGNTGRRSWTQRSQVSDHRSSQKIKLQGRSVNRACNHKVEIPQLRSINGNQNKTISQGGKRQQREKSNKQGTYEKAKL
uniref:Uncharacterized protein n=1 Tax=Tanacetum cinerariifolium TaxID=118510 RepID=A0A699IJJ3_TANCI|nr:hypothetical protein [Tanacetum cinerariifolium]